MIEVKCFLSVSKRKIKLEHEVTKALVGALSKYGLVSNVREPTQNQKFIVLVLSKPDYDFRNLTEYELVSSFALLYFCFLWFEHNNESIFFYVFFAVIFYYSA